MNTNKTLQNKQKKPGILKRIVQLFRKKEPKLENYFGLPPGSKFSPKYPKTNNDPDNVVFSI